MNQKVLRCIEIVAHTPSSSKEHKQAQKFLEGFRSKASKQQAVEQHEESEGDACEEEEDGQEEGGEDDIEVLQDDDDASGEEEEEEAEGETAINKKLEAFFASQAQPKKKGRKPAEAKPVEAKSAPPKGQKGQKTKTEEKKRKPAASSSKLGKFYCLFFKFSF